MDGGTEIARLTATGIGKRFGALQVLEGIDLAMTSDEAIGVVGPNGAGKSTLSGPLRPRPAGSSSTAPT